LSDSASTSSMRRKRSIASTGKAKRGSPNSDSEKWMKIIRRQAWKARAAIGLVASVIVSIYLVLPSRESTFKKTVLDFARACAIAIVGGGKSPEPRTTLSKEEVEFVTLVTGLGFTFGLLEEETGHPPGMIRLLDADETGESPSLRRFIEEHKKRGNGPDVTKYFEEIRAIGWQIGKKIGKKIVAERRKHEQRRRAAVPPPITTPLDPFENIPLLPTQW
jgi:hypothetical protein